MNEKAGEAWTHVLVFLERSVVRFERIVDGLPIRNVLGHIQCFERKFVLIFKLVGIIMVVKQALGTEGASIILDVFLLTKKIIDVEFIGHIGGLLALIYIIG